MSDWFWKKLSFISGWAAIIVLFVLIVFSANIEIKDLDLWLHLATGRYIVTHGMIPKFDVLSFSIAGHPWVNHEWLFQVLVYWIHNFFGFDGLILLQVLVVGTTFALLLFWAYDRDNHPLIVGMLLLTLLVYQLRLTIRPDIFTLLFLTLYILALARHLGQKAIWLFLFIIQVLWTNMHGFFVLGPILIFSVLFTEFIKRRMILPFEMSEIARLSDLEYRHAKILFVLTLTACFFNPNFIEGAVYPFRVLFSISGDSQVFFQYIKELQRPLTLSTIFQWEPYPAFRAILLISGIGLLWNLKKVDLSIFLVWGIFLILALSASRNIVLFSIVACCSTLASLPILSFRLWMPLEEWKERFHYICVLVLNVLLIAVMVFYIQKLTLHGYFDFDNYERKSEYGGVSKRNFPYKAVDFLVKNKIRGNFFNDFNSGAYLLGRASPDIKVFIDGRTEVYGAKFFNDYRKAWEGDTRLFDELSLKYHFTGAFLNSVNVPAPRKTIRHLYKSREWKLVYFDHDAVIFLKDIPENKVWIDKFAIDMSLWKPPTADLYKIGTRKVTPFQEMIRAYSLFNMKLYDQSLYEAKEALRVDPSYDKPYKLIGKIYSIKKDHARAFEYFRNYIIFNPGDVESRYSIANIFFELDRLSEARAQCDKVLSLDQGHFKTLILLSKLDIRDKKFHSAFERLENLKDLDEKSVNDLTELGDLFTKAKEFYLAQEIYLKAMSLAEGKDKQKQITKKMNFIKNNLDAQRK